MNTEQIAEVKGYLCGFICSGMQSEGQLWLDSLSGALHLFDLNDSNQREVLIELYKQVSEDIMNENLGLKETIFEKSLPITTRAYTLKKWCNGFIAGIVHSGLPTKEIKTSEDLSYNLQRFEGISELDLDKMEITEADEAMFYEVAQFVETAVLQVYRILHQAKAKH